MPGCYYRPDTIAKAVEILKEHGKQLKPIAGCTDISVAREEKVLDRFQYIDLTFIKEIHGIKEQDGYIIVGATTTHGEIADSEIINKKGSVLAQACSTVGSPLIRNRGTVGGNVSHASPSGDSIPAIMALNGEMNLASKDADRWITSTEFFKGPGRTVRRDEEILTAVRFKPTGENYMHLYLKLGQRKALSCSKASMAFVARIEGKTLSDVRIACGAVAPTVVRCPKTEEYLNGKFVNPEVISRAKEMVMDEVRPIDDLRSTGAYRTEMMAELLEKALKKI